MPDNIYWYKSYPYAHLSLFYEQTILFFRNEDEDSFEAMVKQNIRKVFELLVSFILYVYDFAKLPKRL